jgi:allophanate hydrolase
MDEGWTYAFAAVVARLRAGGAEIVPVDISPLLEVSSLLFGGAFVAERYAAVGAHVEAYAGLIGTSLDPTVARIILDSADCTAAQYFTDRERLDFLMARTAETLSDFNALLTPTTTGHPTLAEAMADPIGVNARLGRFTNFTNLLDMAAVAVPSGTVRELPFGIMLNGPAFSDGLLTRIAGDYLR